MTRILLVEDVEEMRELMELVLGAIPGFKITGKAANCAEARLELSRRRPDLVLLDEILPGEASYDLLEELGRDGVAVILITGIEHPAHAVPDGALGRIIKPGWDSVEKDRKRLETEIGHLLQGR